MQRRPTALFTAIALLLVAGVARAADEKQYLVGRYIGADKANNQGKQNLAMFVESLLNGRKVTVFVPNNDPAKGEYDPNNAIKGVVANLKQGDFVKIEVGGTPRNLEAKSLAGWAPKPGELSPEGYVFINAYRTKDGHEVVLSKFEQVIKAAVVKIKGESGGMSVDQAIVDRVSAFKAGESVEAEMGKGRVPTLFSIFPYQDPQPAKFVKMAEGVVDEQKAPAVELMIADKPVTALVAGKMAGKKWVPDAKLLGQLKKLKADTEILARTVDDNGKIILKRFEVPKKDKSAKEPVAAPASAK